MKEKGTEALSGKAKSKAEDKKPAGKKKGGKKGDGKGREMHIKQLTDGTFHTQHTTTDQNGIPDGHQPEYSAATPEDLHDLIDQHFGGGGGDDEAAEGEEPPPATSQPQQGQPAAV